MDAYPGEYVAHNLPFIIVSGLGTTPGHEAALETFSEGPQVELKSGLPPLVGERASALLREIQAADASQLPWNGYAERSRTGSLGFRVKAVGRSYVLPPKKARPPSPASGVSPSASPVGGISSSWVLHSPISPLSPGSPIYPDGVLTPLWLRKHDSLVPSVFISFFELTLDASRSSLLDNELKSDINAVKASLTTSGYRTRYVVVLMCDKSVLQAPELDERISSIRRATGLDPKSSLLFLPPGGSRAELVTFVRDLFSILKPQCAEYYKELTKHARRKKNRGHVPPPTVPPTRGTSQTLSIHGWGARFEFKQGVFAEFRQEMDVAGRHYTSAFDALLGPDGIFETTASWSPRWDEARLLADAIAIRILRCLLWNDLPTSAVQSWVNYRDKIRDVVDRRGKGSLNYGWKAWESRWAKVMAELILKAKLFSVAASQGFKPGDGDLQNVSTLYIQPEDIFTADELRPWDFLHHPGYWLNLSTTHAYARRNMAEEIPEEDRSPPGQSPATQVAHRLRAYDTYLCPQPHVEMPLPGNEGFAHSQDIVGILDDAVSEFFARDQQRLVDKLKLQMGQEYTKAAEYTTALSILKPLWQGMIWRSDKWWALVSEVTWALHECALKVHDAETLVATEAEMMCDVLPRPREYEQDFQNCLGADEYRGITPSELAIVLDDKQVTCFLKASFTFLGEKGYVGEPLRSQLSVRSTAHPTSAEVTLSRIEVICDGVLSLIRLRHRKDSSNMPSLSHSDDDVLDVPLQVDLESSEAFAYDGEADLTFAPGQTKVFSMSAICREVGHVSSTFATLTIESARFQASIRCKLAGTAEGSVWWQKGEQRIRQRLPGRDERTMVEILPKPPKMAIRFPSLGHQYYTNEHIIIDVELMNGEEYDTEGVLEGRMMTLSGEESPELCWVPLREEGAAVANRPSNSPQIPFTDLPGLSVSTLAPSAMRTQSVTFKAPSQPTNFVLDVKVLYYLASDRETLISKTTSAEIVIVRPFEANYDFVPRPHPDPWPSYFAVEYGGGLEERKSPSLTVTEGLTHRHRLTAKLVSFATEQLVIKEVVLDVLGVAGGTICKIEEEAKFANDVVIPPQGMREIAFIVDIKKLDVDERSPTPLDLTMKITWCRHHVGARGTVSSNLAVGRFFPAGNDFRILASVQPSPSIPDIIHLAYTLENPTVHFLILTINMEANPDFAFSGPKSQSIKLLPISRTTLNYNILPSVKGTWIVPSLRVLDRYFGKALKVMPAGENIKADRNGIAIWVQDDQDDQDDKDASAMRP